MVLAPTAKLGITVDVENTFAPVTSRFTEIFVMAFTPLFVTLALMTCGVA